MLCVMKISTEQGAFGLRNCFNTADSTLALNVLLHALPMAALRLPHRQFQRKNGSVCSAAKVGIVPMTSVLIWLIMGNIRLKRFNNGE